MKKKYPKEIESFNSKNPEHRKGLVRWLKKETKRKPAIDGILIPQKLYKMMKKISKSALTP